jgi:ubiquitin-protein ligase
MPPPRIKRLQSEYRDMLELQQKCSLISFTVQGTPPTRYDVHLSCLGLCRKGHDIVTVPEHDFLIYLEPNFPLVPPKVDWRTPIFHPNFRGSAVCLGDHWYPNWSLSQMCVVLCEMVQYKIFNIYDPLDPIASEWLRNALEAEPSQFPVDPRPVLDLDFEISQPLAVED